MNKEINIPNHVAIIVDGNGRWGKERGLNRTAGHEEGAKRVEEIAIHAFDSGIKHTSIFAFSTENFKRAKEEVDFLMDLFVKVFTSKLKKIIEKDVKVVFSGRKTNLSKRVLNTMNKLEDDTKNNKSGVLNFCFNYGGRPELIDAYKKMLEDNLNPNELNEENFKKYLYNDLPDIDLMIRTSGEQRISNFMLYNLAYSELYFTNTYWPDFHEKNFDEAIKEYNNRNRRFGKES